MKKLIALLLAIIFAVCLASCETPPEEQRNVYTVTVHFYQNSNNRKLAEDVIFADFEGSPYNVTNQASLAIEGYSVVGVTGSLTGNLYGNQVVVVHYSKQNSDPASGDPTDPGGDTPTTLSDEFKEYMTTRQFDTVWVEGKEIFPGESREEGIVNVSNGYVRRAEDNQRLSSALPDAVAVVGDICICLITETNKKATDIVRQYFLIINVKTLQNTIVEVDPHGLWGSIRHDYSGIAFYANDEVILFSDSLGLHLIYIATGEQKLVYSDVLFSDWDENTGMYRCFEIYPLTSADFVFAFFNQDYIDWVENVVESPASETYLLSVGVPESPSAYTYCVYNMVANSVLFIGTQSGPTEYDPENGESRVCTFPSFIAFSNQYLSTLTEQ